jgi:hypothetical protein
MSDFEHPVKQPIKSVVIVDGGQHDGQPTYAEYSVGYGCDRIEATTKSGMHADIPYIRVWQGDTAIAEFCQHNVAGVYFFAKDS